MATAIALIVRPVHRSSGKSLRSGESKRSVPAPSLGDDLMRKDFEGKVAVVTGASSGIGRELARQLAAAGARVGLIARRSAELESLAQDISARGGRALPLSADVADKDQVDRAVQSVRDELGPIELMIASAGVGMPTLLDPVNLPDIEAM